MAKAKFEQIIPRTLRRVRDGSPPDAAWVATLRELYSWDKVASQEKDTFPKWAFSVLCHRGYVRGVQPECCPSAESSSSAAFALAALQRLLADPSLARDKQELKRLVFGETGTEGYRTPNDEIEVLLFLWASDELACCAGIA